MWRRRWQQRRRRRPAATAAARSSALIRFMRTFRMPCLYCSCCSTAGARCALGRRRRATWCCQGDSGPQNLVEQCVGLVWVCGAHACGLLGQLPRWQLCHAAPNPAPGSLGCWPTTCICCGSRARTIRCHCCWDRSPASCLGRLQHSAPSRATRCLATKSSSRATAAAPLPACRRRRRRLLAAQPAAHAADGGRRRHAGRRHAVCGRRHHGLQGQADAAVQDALLPFLAHGRCCRTPTALAPVCVQV